MKEERKEKYVIGRVLSEGKEVDITVTRVNQTGAQDINGEFFNIDFGMIPFKALSPAPFRDLEGNKKVTYLNKMAIT